MRRELIYLKFSGESIVPFTYFDSIDINNLEEFYSITTKLNGLFDKIEVES